MTRSRFPSRQRSEAVTGDRNRHQGGAVALSGGFVVLGRTGGPGHFQTLANVSYPAVS
jgi:hypothetical protein